MVKLTLISSEEGDWHALYANDGLVIAGYSLQPKEILQGITEYLPNTWEDKKVSLEWFENGPPTVINFPGEDHYDEGCSSCKNFDYRFPVAKYPCNHCIRNAMDFYEKKG